MTATTSCRVPGCNAQISKWKLMCLPHWYMVPKSIQHRVVATLGVWRDRGTDAARDQYLNAVADAVQTVQTVQVAMDKKARATGAT